MDNRGIVVYSRLIEYRLSHMDNMGWMDGKTMKNFVKNGFLPDISARGHGDL